MYRVLGRSISKSHTARNAPNQCHGCRLRTALPFPDLFYARIRSHIRAPNAEYESRLVRLMAFLADFATDKLLP